MTDSQDLLGDLNPEQREAVEHFEGPLLVLAGAGSGKTRVITRRVAYLIQKHGVPPQSILGLTFTNKAAQEMSDRLDYLLGDGVDGGEPWLGTFHSLGAHFLRDHIQSIDARGRNRYFTIFDGADQKRAVKEVLEDLDISTDEFSPGMMANVINKAKNELVGPEEVREEKFGQYEDYFLRQLERVYRAYEEHLAQYNALDFGDLISLPVKLLQEGHPLADSWRKRFKFLLVDEYQDTNHGQYEFSRQLSREHGNICVVGDDDQAIFGWRGADVTNILEFEEDFPDTKVVHLSKNYRSTQSILRAANSVIENNSRRKEKRMRPHRDEGQAITVYPARDETDEAKFVADEIQSLRRKGYQLGDIAVLYRVNTLSRQLEESLIRANVPYEIIQGTRFYERREVKDVLAYLRIIYNPSDDLSIQRVINRPRRGIGDKTQQQVYDYAERRDLNYWDALKDLAEGDSSLSSRQQGRIAVFLNLMEDFRAQVGQAEPTELVEDILDGVDYMAHLDKEYDQESAGERKDNIRELLGQLEEAQSVESFLEMVALESNISRFEGDADRVSLLTLHSAKGLEFDCVFLAGMEQGLLPHRRSIDEGRLEEERRLCYVGMTRAKDHLYLTYAQQRFLYGRTVRNQASRFLEEVSEDELCFLSSSASGERGYTSSGESGADWRDFLTN